MSLVLIYCEFTVVLLTLIFIDEFTLPKLTFVVVDDTLGLTVAFVAFVGGKVTRFLFLFPVCVTLAGFLTFCVVPVAEVTFRVV